MKTSFENSKVRAQQRVEHAKRSLQDHVQELGRRFRDIKTREDVSRWIAAHPWQAVGIAAALGAFAGLASGAARGREQVQRSIGGMTVAAIGAVVMKLLKNVAIDHVSEAVRGWTGGDSEREASNEPALEAFFDH